MLFLNKITQVGGESVYNNGNSIYRQIIYNQLNENGGPEYSLIYEENYKLEEGLDVRLNLSVPNNDTTTLYRDHKDDDSSILEIDTDNLTDFCVNIVNTHVLPTGMTVTQDTPTEISLYGNNDTIVDFSFVPDQDGIAYHLKDTLIYSDYKVKECNTESIVSDLPILYKKNILMKMVYTNNYLINKDYRDNTVFIFENKVNPVIDMKYNKVLELSLGNYKLYRLIPTYSKVRNKISDECKPTDTFNINNFSISDYKLAIYSGSTEKVIFDFDEFRHMRSESTKTYSILYPSHFVSILGNIVIDDKDYKIYTEEEIVVERNKVISHNIWYHRLDKETIKSLNEL